MSSGEAPASRFVAEEKTLWERAAETRWGAYLTRHQREALLFGASLPGEPGVSVEVGCEGGRWSRLLHHAGWKVVCTDVDEEMLELCGRRIPEATCVLVQPTDATIPFDGASARLLLVSEVAPVSQSDWFPGEAGRVLEPGGVLVCTFYNPASPRGIAYRMLRRIEAWRRGPGGHFYEHFYGGRSYVAFRRQLERQGFRLLREEGLCWFPFTRQSNSGLVPLCTRLEGLLGLRRLVSVSPFVILVAQKSASHPRTAAGPAPAQTPP